jgi:hypothetical protein
VNRSLEQPATAHGLASAGELLRTFSGLVSVIALLGIVAGLAVLGAEGTRPIHVTLGPDTAAVGEAAPQSLDALPSGTRTVVLYLAETLDQVRLADEGESLVRGNGNRSYLVVFDEQALRLAYQGILDGMLTQDASVLVQIVDLRADR